MKIRFKDCGGVLQALFVIAICGMVSLHAGLTDPAACSDDEDSLSMNLSDVCGGPVSDLESRLSEENLSAQLEALDIGASDQLCAKDDGVSLDAWHHVSMCLDLFRKVSTVFDWGNGEPNEETLLSNVQTTINTTKKLLLERNCCTCDWEVNWIDQFIVTLVDQLLWYQETFTLNDALKGYIKQISFLSKDGFFLSKDGFLEKFQLSEDTKNRLNELSKQIARDKERYDKMCSHKRKSRQRRGPGVLAASNSERWERGLLPVKQAKSRKKR